MKSFKNFRLILIVSISLLLSIISGFYGKYQILILIIVSSLLYCGFFIQNINNIRNQDFINLLLVISGCGLIWFGCQLPEIGKILSWSVALCLMAYGIFISIGAYHSFKAVRTLLICLTFFLFALLTIGYNPFIGTKYAVAGNFKDYAYSSRGVYMIKKDSLIGFRDRIAIIVQPEFQSIEILKASKPFLAVTSSKGTGIFNLETHEFDVKPTPRCKEIYQVNDSTWNMMNKDGVAYRQIILPKYWIKDFENHQLRSHEIKDKEGNVSKDYLRDIAEEFEMNAVSEEIGLNKICENLKEPYAILGKMTRASGCENTPANNLSWHYMVKEMINETGIHQDTIISGMRDIIGWYSGGTQIEMNNAAYMEQLLAQYQHLDAVATHLEEFPGHYNEYEAFSKLESAFLQKWIEEMYEDNHYSSLPMDVSAGIVSYLNKNSDILLQQYKLLTELKSSGSKIKVHISGKLVQEENLEIEELLNNWKNLRKEISTLLSFNKQKLYQEIEDKLIENLFSLYIGD